MTQTILAFNLTELETKTLEAYLIENEGYEVDFSYTTAKSLAKATGIAIDSIKGVIGSLVKKELLYAEKTEVDSVLLIGDKAMHLHPSYEA